MWSFYDGLYGNPPETSRNWPRQFPAGFQTFFINKIFEEKNVLIKNQETCRKPAAVVPKGFCRFPDFFIIKKHFEKKNVLIKNLEPAGNWPLWFPKFSVGFWITHH